MSSQQSTPCWIWRPLEDEDAAGFRHPGQLPVGDQAAAKAAFVEAQRGPRVARLSQGTMLQLKGNMALVAERGVTYEVPKSMILPWYEGLLVLEALDAVQGQAGHIQAAWLDDDLKEVLKQERSKFQTGRLNGALYAEKRLLTTAVTGSKFVDSAGKSWDHRRENLRTDGLATLPDGEEGDGHFKVREIVGYIPPWEAFHHEKCGFYQDFYQVRWEYPFSEVDYGTVENGSAEVKGATWEPDECLPVHMDPLRLAAKRSWIQARKDKEAQGFKRKGESPEGTVASASPPVVSAVKKERPDDVPPRPPAKLARMRRDGKPLEKDLFRGILGHDFAPEKVEQELGQIRTGWPKRAQDYPPGFGVASPPGFCWAECDCMDDQRPQNPWETKKAWLEEPSRHQAAHTAVETFAQQVHFVRKRGLVSKMCFFESASGRFQDQTGARAAYDLAISIERAVQAVLMQVPVTSLSEPDTVRVPARAYLPGGTSATDPAAADLDYEPLRCTALVATGESLPHWVTVNSEDCSIVVTRQPAETELPLQLRIDFCAAEGPVGKAHVNIVAQSFTSSASPWFMVTAALAQKFNDTARCPLERGVWSGLYEHFKEIYDFGKRSSKDTTLGLWMTVVSRILVLLRSACGASLALGGR